MINESAIAEGMYIFEAYSENGERRPEFDFIEHNVVTQGFFTNVFKFLNRAISQPNIDSLNLTHIAVGTETQIASKQDTVLGNEYFRKQISAKSFDSSQFTCKLSLATSEANGTITEVGVFANGTDAKDSGTLISRCNVNIEKNSNIKYLVTYILTLK